MSENNQVAAVGLASYVVFSVDNAGDTIEANYGKRIKLQAFLDTLAIGYSIGEGRYQGTGELAWCVAAKDYAAIARAGFLNTQESILVLGPRPDRDGYRPATLHFLNAPQRLPEALGFLVPCSVPHAEAQEAYSVFDGQAYVCTFDPSECEEEVTEKDVADFLAADNARRHKSDDINGQCIGPTRYTDRA